MFGNQRSKQVKVQIENLESERDRLNDSLLTTKNSLAELKQKKKMEDEDIRHLVKIKESKLQIDFDKKEVKLEKEKQDAIARVKDEYRDKQEKVLEKQIDQGEKRYAEILARLPDVSVALKGKV